MSIRHSEHTSAHYQQALLLSSLHQLLILLPIQEEGEEETWSQAWVGVVGAECHQGAAELQLKVSGDMVVGEVHRPHQSQRPGSADIL